MSFSATAGLFLILLLCCGEEVFQDASQVVKGGPVIRVLLPAPQHHVIQPLRAVIWSGHSVGALQILDHFWIGHACTGQEGSHMLHKLT